MRFILAMARRESRGAGRRVALLTVAVALGVGALVAINSFTDNLAVSVKLQSRVLMGADLTVSSRQPFTPAAKSLLDTLAAQAGPQAHGANLATVTSFAGMALVKRTATTRLVRVAAIEGGYPFYGEIKTAPAGEWARLQDQRSVLVDQSFLPAFGAAVGDTMTLGETRFVISGTVLNFPGDVGVRAALGPRIYIPARYLDATGLLGLGSRAEYEAYVKLDGTAKVADLSAQFRRRFSAERATLRTYAEDERDLKQFFDQLGRYLGLVALIALLLGGIGVGSAVGVFIRQKRETIAILRCLGATSRQIFAVYLLQAAAIGLIGSGAGVLLGVALQLLLPGIVGDFLPVDVSPIPSLGAVVTGLSVGLWVAGIFALLPLLGVRQIAPLEVLRRPYEDAPRKRDPLSWAAFGVLVLSVVGLAMLQVRNPRNGAFFAGAVGLALLVLWLAALGLIRGLRRRFPHRLPYVWRQGFANLYRPANQTVAVVLALGFGAFLLTTLALVQANLLRELRLDAGPGRPNLVFFDIQPDQLAGLDSLLADLKFKPTAPVPIVPMRIASVKGRAVTTLLGDSIIRGDSGERLGRWAFRREYRSTYRDTTVASEKVIAGKWWAADGKVSGWTGDAIPISIEVSVAGELGATVGDEIVWDIQGVSLKTRIASMREVNWARFEPNFYVVFPPGAIETAPQTFVTLTRVDDPTQLGLSQRRVVERYPNVTSIDVSLIQRAVERVVANVVLAIRFMALFSLATGTVVLIGSVATSRFQRIRETVLLKTLGATRRQVIRVALAEYLALGVLAAGVAIVLASVAGWGLAKWFFEIKFSLPAVQLSALATAIAALTILVGLWSSVDVFRKPPLEVLREE